MLTHEVVELGLAAGHREVAVLEQVGVLDRCLHQEAVPEVEDQRVSSAPDRRQVLPRQDELLVTVTVGEEYLGAVMTDLSGRRGQVLGSDSVNRKAIVRALVPQAELSRYAIDLRGIGHGSGTFTREFHGYELLPGNLLEKYARK